MSTDLAIVDSPEMAKAVEKAVLNNDLSALTAPERLAYYMKFCESVGLNPATQPLQYIKLNGKLCLYATRACAEQLRKVHKVSLQITDRTLTDGVYIVSVRAKDVSGREDESTGVVSVDNLKGENLANALMKAETKAKRRVTLSICSLGLLDETEVSTIPSARAVDFDHATGEIIEPTAAPSVPVDPDNAGSATDSPDFPSSGESVPPEDPDEYLRATVIQGIKDQMERQGVPKEAVAHWALVKFGHAGSTTEELEIVFNALTAGDIESTYVDEKE